MSRGGAERGRGSGGDTEFEAGSRLRAVSTEPDSGLRDRDLSEVGRLTDRAAQAPRPLGYFILCFWPQISHFLFPSQEIGICIMS